jgi:hypothetical protein
MSKIRVEGVVKSFPDRQSASAAEAMVALSHIDLNIEAPGAP